MQCVSDFYRAIETGDEALLRRVLAPDWQELPPAYPGQPDGPDGYLPIFRGFKAAFPDGVFDLHEIIAAPPKYVVRTTMRGTHAGPFLGRAATGRAIRFDTIDIHEVAEGVIRRSWHIEDFFGAISQIEGASP